MNKKTFDADAQFFRADMQFSIIFGGCITFHSGSTTFRVVRGILMGIRKSYIREPVRHCASAESMCSTCSGVGCSGRLHSTSGSTSSSLQSPCFVLDICK